MQKRPFSTYANNVPPSNLPRIQSELEVISEKEDSHHHKPNDMMIDESYSFSLRQFEKQTSKGNMSNRSNSYLGTPAQSKALGSVQRQGGSKLSLRGSSQNEQFGPFSKKRKRGDKKKGMKIVNIDEVSEYEEDQYGFNIEGSSVILDSYRQTNNPAEPGKTPVGD